MSQRADAALLTAVLRIVALMQPSKEQMSQVQFSPISCPIFFFLPRSFAGLNLLLVHETVTEWACLMSSTAAREKGTS